MANYLVTGGAGFIGSNIAEALVAAGHDVRVLDNLSTGKLENMDSFRDRIEFIQGDLTIADDVARAVQDIEVIIHQAALASVPMSIESPLDTNAACVTGTVQLLDAARRAGVRRVVYAGSSAAYGDEPTTSKRETDYPAPLSPYGAAKLAAEFYCRAFWESYGLETVTLRYFNVFGPRQDPQSTYAAVIPIFITALIAGRRPTIFGDGRQTRDFIYVGNIVDANLLAATTDADKVAGRMLNIGCGRQIDLLTLFSALRDLLGSDIEPIFQPPRAGDVRDSLADIIQARTRLGFEPRVGLEEGLARSIEYYKSVVECV